MQKKFQKDNQITNVYPAISDKLINCLRQDFPDKLPRKYQDAYCLGILVGQQQVIDKLVLEKKFNEEN